MRARLAAQNQETNKAHKHISKYGTDSGQHTTYMFAIDTCWHKVLLIQELKDSRTPRVPSNGTTLLRRSEEVSPSVGNNCRCCCCCCSCCCWCIPSMFMVPGRAPRDGGVSPCRLVAPFVVGPDHLRAEGCPSGPGMSRQVI